MPCIVMSTKYTFSLNVSVMIRITDYVSGFEIKDVLKKNIVTVVHLLLLVVVQDCTPGK